jgi:hypothetical protein
MIIDRLKKIFDPLKEVYYTKVNTKVEVKEKFFFWFTKKVCSKKTTKMPLRIDYRAYDYGRGTSREERIIVSIIFEFWDNDYKIACCSGGFKMDDLINNETILRSNGFKSIYDGIMVCGNDYKLPPQETLMDTIMKPEFKTFNVPEVTPDP